MMCEGVIAPLPLGLIKDLQNDIILTWNEIRSNQRRCGPTRVACPIVLYSRGSWIFFILRNNLLVFAVVSWGSRGYRNLNIYYTTQQTLFSNIKRVKLQEHDNKFSWLRASDFHSSRSQGIPLGNHFKYQTLRLINTTQYQGVERFSHFCPTTKRQERKNALSTRT